MTRLAYCDLANGISGDMAMAALAHAGRRLGVHVETAITDAVTSLGLGCAVTFVDDERGGLACLRAEVKTDNARLTPAQLREAIVRADVGEHVRDNALKGLDVLVEAEATVHGLDATDVHLHELGSPDTAVDLVGAATGLDALGVTEVTAAPVPVATGWIESSHGALPLPAPAMLEILRGATLRGTAGDTELVTPTGAAILVSHQAVFGPLPAMTLDAVGIGAGLRTGSVDARPNISRVLIGERAEEQANIDTCVLLETNIDDQTPQGIAHAVDLLLQHGAVDAWITPIVMKKSRPAFLLSALVRPQDETKLTDSILRNTTTLGVRRRFTNRWVADREIVRVSVQNQHVDVKIARLSGDITNIAPEFDDCVRIAERTGRPLKDIQDEAVEHARRSLGD
jgi:pyridinium-3,5-bisthiocarboxylic acid mononucleotide nickel chelatase